MFLVELVMQGVRGIREVARLRFQSGFNFVAAGNESGKTASVDTVLRLLFPRNTPGLMDALLSKRTQEASRAALVAFSDDGAYYRLIEDFSKRAVNLSKYNGATKDFAVLYKDWDNTVQFMTRLTAGTTEEEYNRLFIFRREHYAGWSGPTLPPVVPVLRAGPDKPGAPERGKAGERDARLAELREALRKAEEAADADYRLQSAKLRLDEIKGKLDGIEEISHRYADIDANLESLKGCETLPQNILHLIDEHEQRQSQKMADSDKLTKEIDGLQLQLDTTPPVKLVTDKLFILGATLGALSFLAGLLAVFPAEYENFFPLGILIALALVVVAWYQGSRRSAERKMITKEIEGLQAELAELEKSFEHGGAAISACMKATGSSTAAELKDKAENYRHFVYLREGIDEQRKRLLGDLRPGDLQAEYGRQQEDVLELEKAARAVAQYAVDPYAIRQDIERLEMESQSGAPTDSGFGPQGHSPAPGLAAPVTAAGQPGFLAELRIASRIGGIEMETLIPAVEAAAQRNLLTITGGRYVRIEAAREGDPIVHAKDDSPVNFSELSHGTRDAIYFCLRTGLVEAIAGKRRLPFILDDPFGGFDPARQRAACQILRALGAKTQVLLYASNPALKAAGDAAAELK